MSEEKDVLMTDQSLEEKRNYLWQEWVDICGISGLSEQNYYRNKLIQEREECQKYENELDRLHTWKGIMSLIDEYYPTDIFTENCKDPGCQVIWSIRKLDAEREAHSKTREELANRQEKYTNHLIDLNLELDKAHERIREMANTMDELLAWAGEPLIRDRTEWNRITANAYSFIRELEGK